MRSVAMSSDALVQPSPNDTLAYSPLRESESTDDTIARLYFGPQTSPEKRLIKAMLGNDESTPRRRSTKLGSPTSTRSPSPSIAQPVERGAQQLDPLVKHDSFEALELDSGCDTPDNNHDFQDEPSSVLAGRIIRAHDNPSPPPNSHGSPIGDFQSVSPNLGQIQDRSIPSEIANSLPAASIPTLDLTEAEQPVGNTSEPDLMSFTSVSTPPDTPHGLHQSEISRPLPAPTIDDLLSRSPTPPQDGPLKERSLTQETHHSLPLGDTELNAMHVEGKPEQTHDGLVQVQNSPPKSPPRRRRQLTSDSQQSPLLRSKRRSVSPMRFTSHLQSVAPSTVIAPLRLPPKINQTLEADGSRPSVGEPEIDDHADDTNATGKNERTGRKRKRKNDEAVSDRVGSSSPRSTPVPQQEIPVPKPDLDAGDQIMDSPRKPSSLNLPQRVRTFTQPNVVSTPVKYRETTGDINRTPARRVPVSLAPGQGSSPWKEQTGMRVFGGTIFRTQALDDPTRSPARRVLVADIRSTPNKNVPNLAFSKERSGSVKPRPSFKGRSASVEPVFSRPPNFLSSLTSKVATPLPFPITPKPLTIREEGEDDSLPSAGKPRATSAPPVVSPTPVTSTLKQPTVTSRIPRIGVKPYARPPGPEKSKLPVSTLRVHGMDNLARMSRGGGSGSSSDDAKEKFSQMPATKKKREAETKPSLFTNIQPQIVKMRQVPGIRAHERARPSLTQIEEHTELPYSEDNFRPLRAGSVQIPDSLERRTRSATRISKHAEDFVSPTDDVEHPGVRRTPRLRKTPALRGDLFGNTSPEAPKAIPVKTKRKAPQGSGYASLSSLALKNLTINNTAKNQQIVNTLDMEIVRKEGRRPESPTTKLRTISERQKEEKARQRQERAQRRARKIELGEIVDSDADASFMSDLPLGDNGQPLKHRRGPGDEEDYETPERPVRPSKRTKVEGNEQEENDKRVQWDRGLFTAVYLDELPDARRWPRNENAKKGCLSQGAKALRLDPLGNVESADAPITHMTIERVVVKKFVYDEDEPEPLPEIKPLRVVKSKGRKAKS